MTNPRNLIAILRGVRSGEVVDICAALVEAGISRIEVPLNSPDPFDAIERVAREMNNVQIGAGTVIQPQEVDRLARIGCQFIVSPNCDTAVIARTKQLGMGSFPGILTPSEAYQAIHAGADGLKIFPANLPGPAGIAAMRAALPAGDLYAVGGAEPDNFTDYRRAGCLGFGLGSYLYRPGTKVTLVRQKAALAVTAYDALDALVR